MPRPGGGSRPCRAGPVPRRSAPGRTARSQTGRIRRPGAAPGAPGGPRAHRLQLTAFSGMAQTGRPAGIERLAGGSRVLAGLQAPRADRALRRGTGRPVGFG